MINTKIDSEQHPSRYMRQHGQWWLQRKLDHTLKRKMQQILVGQTFLKSSQPPAWREQSSSQSLLLLFFLAAILVHKSLRTMLRFLYYGIHAEWTFSVDTELLTIQFCQQKEGLTALKQRWSELLTKLKLSAHKIPVTSWGTYRKAFISLLHSYQVCTSVNH